MPNRESEQLFLSIDDLAQRTAGAKVPKAKRIFCNRDLRMADVTWIGFDMDYTLAIYDQPEMDRLQIEATIEKLIRQRAYPEFIRDVAVPLDFPVRGLLIDKRFGNVLKMDRYKQVCKGFHGFRELTKDELRELYHSKNVRPATARYHWIDTLYALAEVSLYTALIDILERRKHDVDYARIFTDIRECIDEAHRDGTVLDAVASDLPRFIRRDPELPLTLHKLRSAGKKLFVLTNSRLSYTEKMMTYLLGGALAEYPNWRNYFDIAVVAASKPAFFQERRPLLQRDGDQTRPADFPLERGRVYEAGNLQEFERVLNVTGDQVLYVGDHIYGDILRSKKDSAWRTIMVIQELEREVLAHDACFEELQQVERLGQAREVLEEDLRFHQHRFKELSRQLEVAQKAGSAQVPDIEGERIRQRKSVDLLKARLKQVGEELELLGRRIDAQFHPYWGPLLKEASEESLFGSQIEAYACLYTSRVSNLLAYSPLKTFHSRRDIMAHELGD